MTGSELRNTVKVQSAHALKACQLAIAWAEFNQDEVLLDEGYAVFSALMATNLRQEIVSIPRDPLEQYLKHISEVVQGAFKWKQQVF